MLSSENIPKDIPKDISIDISIDNEDNNTNIQIETEQIETEHNIIEKLYKTVEWYVSDKKNHNIRRNGVSFEAFDAFTIMQVHVLYDTEQYSVHVGSGGGNEVSYTKIIPASFDNTRCAKIATIHGITTEQEIIDLNFEIYTCGSRAIMIACEENKIEEIFLAVIEKNYEADVYDTYTVEDIHCKFVQSVLATYILSFIPYICYVHYFFGLPISILGLLCEFLDIMNIYSFTLSHYTKNEVLMNYLYNSKIPSMAYVFYFQNIVEMLFLCFSFYLVSFHTWLYWHIGDPFPIQIMLCIMFLHPFINLILRYKNLNYGKKLKDDGVRWWEVG
jgi:hypothetical protein